VPRTTLAGLKQGDRIHVVGAGRFGNGSFVSPGPEGYAWYRPDYSGGQHLAKIGKIRKVLRPRVPTPDLILPE
jgi:hypothetical protein